MNKPQSLLLCSIIFCHKMFCPKVKLISCYLVIHNSRSNRPFAASHSRGTKLPRWRAKVALGQDKQKTYIWYEMVIFFVNLVPVRLLLSRTAVLYHVNALLAAKGLLRCCWVSMFINLSHANHEVCMHRWTFFRVMLLRLVFESSCCVQPNIETTPQICYVFIG